MEKTNNNTEIQYEDSLGDDSKRVLAEITTIKELKRIEGADRIEIATFTTNFWQCIVGKNEFRTGDKAIFFSIDSFLPKEDRYAILEGRCNKVFKNQEGYLIRSVKMRGEISQGFCMPISAFANVAGICQDIIADGTDVTELLGVKLYQKSVKGTNSLLLGNVKNNFPSFIPKTDQKRIQSMKSRDIMKLFDHLGFEISEKIDGSSLTVYCRRREEPVYDCYIDPNSGQTEGSKPNIYYDFGVCSRNLELKPPGVETIIYKDDDGTEHTKEIEVKSTYWEMAKKYSIEERLTQYCKETSRSLAVLGEMIGAGINGNNHKLNDVQFYVFDIFDIDKQRYVNSMERTEIINSLNLYDGELPIQMVPILGIKPLSPTCDQLTEALGVTNTQRVQRMHDTGIEDAPQKQWTIFVDALVAAFVRDLLKQADGKSKIGGNDREGCVFKSIIDPMVSLKCISNNYLLKNEQ